MRLLSNSQNLQIPSFFRGSGPVIAYTLCGPLLRPCRRLIYLYLFGNNVANDAYMSVNRRKKVVFENLNTKH